MQWWITCIKSKIDPIIFSIFCLGVSAEIVSQNDNWLFITNAVNCQMRKSISDSCICQHDESVLSIMNMIMMMDVQPTYLIQNTYHRQKSKCFLCEFLHHLSVVSCHPSSCWIMKLWSVFEMSNRHKMRNTMTCLFGSECCQTRLLHLIDWGQQSARCWRDSPNAGRGVQGCCVSCDHVCLHGQEISAACLMVCNILSETAWYHNWQTTWTFQSCYSDITQGVHKFVCAWQMP